MQQTQLDELNTAFNNLPPDYQLLQDTPEQKLKSLCKFCIDHPKEGQNITMGTEQENPFLWAARNQVGFGDNNLHFIQQMHAHWGEPFTKARDSVNNDFIPAVNNYIKDIIDQELSMPDAIFMCCTMDDKKTSWMKYAIDHDKSLVLTNNMRKHSTQTEHRHNDEYTLLDPTKKHKAITYAVERGWPMEGKNSCLYALEKGLEVDAVIDEQKITDPLELYQKKGRQLPKDIKTTKAVKAKIEGLKAAKPIRETLKNLGNYLTGSKTKWTYKMVKQNTQSKNRTNKHR